MSASSRNKALKPLGTILLMVWLGLLLGFNLTFPWPQ